MTTPLIEARNLDFEKAGRKILQHIDLAVAAGEIVTIIGPNGAGKTTLIKVLMGLQRPTGGTLTRRPGTRAGYVPQRFHIDPVLPLTVRRLLDLTRPASHADAAAALEEVGVAHLSDQSVHGLSGGEMQRVLLARALLGRPDILFLDEPTQGVDFAGEIALYDLIAGIRKRLGCAVVMISHDLHVVMASTDRVLCLNHHVCCMGEPESVARHPAYRRLFGEAAAGQLALYSHDHDHSHDIAGHLVFEDDGSSAPDKETKH